MRTYTEEEALRALETISMEAKLNPFASIRDAIKDKLHILGSRMSTVYRDFIKATSDADKFETRIFSFYSKPPYEIAKLKELEYQYIREMMIPNSRGFIGTYSEYCKFLNHQMKIYEQLRTDVLVPAHDFILLCLGKPSVLSSASLKHSIQLHTDNEEVFKKQMNIFFNHKKLDQERKVKTIFGNSNEIFMFYNVEARQLMNTTIASNKGLTNIIHAYKGLLESIDLLFVRIEQNPDKFNLTNNNADELSKILYAVAREMEMYSATMNLSTQFLSVADYGFDKITGSYN